MIRSILLLLVAITAFTSCKDDVLVKQQWEWDNHQWLHNDRKSMTIEAVDTTTQYAMDLDLNWDKAYGYQNLYIRTLTKFPSGKEVTSVTSMEMTEGDGSWAGKCSGHSCTLSFPLQKIFTFPEVGTYTWSIEPYMRVDTVDGIHSLRVTCRKLKK